MANSDYTIGVVGVGRMGANIARHLNDEGFSVVAVYDADGERATSLGEEIGAEATDQLARVTELADYIITVVTDDNAMRQIFSEDADDSLLKGANVERRLSTARQSRRRRMWMSNSWQKSTAHRALRGVWQAVSPKHEKVRCI